MPFTFTPKTAGDLIRSQDWNAAMTAIAALFDKFNFDATIGHDHSGGTEQGPQIGTAGLQDAAVTLQKLANLAVSAAKIQTNAVTADKIANGAVESSKIANGAVGNSQIANAAVNSTKIASNSINAGHILANSIGASELANNAVQTTHILNGAVTAAKLASGVAPEIGIAISNVGDGQTAAIPSGFTTAECRFMCALKYVQFNLSGSGTQPVNATINTTTRVVSIGNTSNAAGVAVVMALGKKGGW